MLTNYIVEIIIVWIETSDIASTLYKSKEWFAIRKLSISHTISEDIDEMFIHNKAIYKTK